MYSKTVRQLYGGGSRIALFGNQLPETIALAKKMFPRERPFSTAFGIEVEIERSRHTEMVDRGLWDIKADTSLRDDGIELVSAPLQGEYILQALANLDLFYKANPRAVFSHRCSVHVHADVTKLTYEQLLVFLAFYLTVEDVFFAVFFPDRKGNNYCFPLVSTQLTQKDIQRQRLRRETWKYAALNLYHLMDFGTVEFRQNPGTKDVHALLAWIRTIQNIYDYALKTPLKEFLTVLNDLNTTSGYAEYIRLAMPDWAFPIEPDNMYDAVTAAKFFLARKGDE